MKHCDSTGNISQRYVGRRKDFKTEEKLDGFIVKKEISFSYPLEDGRIYCEDIIEYGDDLYRVKEAPAKGGSGSVVAAQDTYSLSGNPFQDFVAEGATVSQCVSAALGGTGWTYENISANDTDIRNISESNTDSMKLLEKIAEVFWVEMAFSAKKKKVYLYSKIGNTGGTARFIKGFNLKTLEVKTDTYDFYTRLYPVGKDGLTIAAANGGIEYLDNNQYSSAVIAVIWEDTNYTDASHLKSDGEKKLAELSIPKTTYTLQIIDVANVSDGYDDFAFSIGDEADILDPDLEINTRERIIRIVRYPDKPEKNAVELANRTMNFSDMQKKLLAAAESISNVSNGNIVIGSKVDSVPVNKIEGLQAEIQGTINDIDIAGTSIAFSENSGYGLASGDTVATLFGKILNFINTVKSIAPNFLSSGLAPLATKLNTKRYIDGVAFDGSANIAHYGTCSTAAATAAKTASITGFSLVTGARVTVLFSNGNTAASPTLNVTSTGAKPIYYRGAAIPANYIQSGAVLSLVYSGSYWRIEGDLTGYLLNEKSPTAHASSATTYGISTATLYGHAKASATTPKAPGTAAVGSETAAFARGDHVHPLPITDVTSKFTWTNCANYKAYKIGNVVFFRAEVTAKSTSAITVATTSDTTLTPSALTPLLIQFSTGADVLKRGICWAYTDGSVKITTLAGWTSTTAQAITGNALISGQWFVA